MATDIVDLVGQYVALKKAGREFKGLCPFHEDHHPSMFVSPAKQIFKCFVCGAGGGVFQFAMMYDKLSFPEAVKALAERAHIPLPREPDAQPVPAGLGKDDLTKVTAWAADFFHGQLLSPSGAAAMQYARKRGLTDESIERFKLGYAPDFWDALLRAAGRDGIGTAQLLACGLVIQRDRQETAVGGREWGVGSGTSAAQGPRPTPYSPPPTPYSPLPTSCYDRFRNRLMFPIYDAAGRVIAFGGRALAADERAKYLNSPETVLFDKSGSLYAMNWSREGISAKGQAIVVEGYMDAIMPLQVGLTNVVATLGTALTERHIRLLSRYAKEIVLVYDADAAGAAATERALEVFIQQQVHVRVATIPEGKDPCDYSLARGREAMEKLIADAPDALQYLWQRRLADYEAAGGNLADRRRVAEDFLRVVATSAAYGTIDEVRRGQLAQHIGHILNISAADLQQEMRRLSRDIPRASLARPAPTGPREESSLGAGPELRAQRHVLEVLLNRPDLFESAAERVGVEDFANERLGAIARCVWELGTAGRLSLDEILPMESMSPHAGLIAELVEAGEQRGNYEATLAGAVEHLVYRRSRRDTEAIKSSGLTDQTLHELDQRLRRPDARRFPGVK